MSITRKIVFGSSWKHYGGGSDKATIQQKLKWLMAHDNPPLKSLCADKLAVRGYVSERLGLHDDSMFVPVIGVWDRAEDIDFDSLPDRFVLKCNHGSGYNIVCRDKSSFDADEARKRIKLWLKSDYSKKWGEKFYSRIVPKAFAEEYLDTKDVFDYKFWCFNGEPRFFSRSRNNVKSNHKTTYYDLSGKLLRYSLRNHPSTFKPLDPFPDDLPEMTEYARRLSEDFTFVRVDFMKCDGRLYFGELTFIPGCARFKFRNSWHDREVGSFLKLPE